MRELKNWVDKNASLRIEFRFSDMGSRSIKVSRCWSLCCLFSFCILCFSFLSMGILFAVHL
jgi:hypothetical protein